MTQQWVTEYHLTSCLLSTAMTVNGEPPETLMLNASTECGSSGSLGRNNEKDICTLVLKMGLVIVLAPHIRQTWSYLKVNKIRPTNNLKAKYLWGCPGFSSSLLFNVPVRLNEVIDRRPLLVEVHSSCSVSILSHPAEICIVDCHTAPLISQKEASSLSKCKNLFLLLWVVGKGDYAEVPHVMLAQDKRTWVMYSGVLSFCIIRCHSVWQHSPCIQGSLSTSVSYLIQEVIMNHLVFFTFAQSALDYLHMSGGCGT